MGKMKVVFFMRKKIKIVYKHLELSFRYVPNLGLFRPQYCKVQGLCSFNYFSQRKIHGRMP